MSGTDPSARSYRAKLGELGRGLPLVLGAVLAGLLAGIVWLLGWP